MKGNEHAKKKWKKQCFAVNATTTTWLYFCNLPLNVISFHMLTWVNTILGQHNEIKMNVAFPQKNLDHAENNTQKIFQF